MGLSSLYNLCQKRKIFPFLPPHLGRHEQQQYHKTLQQTHAAPLQQTQAVYILCLLKNPLGPGRSTAEPSERAAQRGAVPGSRGCQNPALPCPFCRPKAHGGCTARFLSARRKKMAYHHTAANNRNFMQFRSRY